MTDIGTKSLGTWKWSNTVPPAHAQSQRGKISAESRFETYFVITRLGVIPYLRLRPAWTATTIGVMATSSRTLWWIWPPIKRRAHTYDNITASPPTIRM